MFFFNDTAITEIYTLSLTDALPIWSDADSFKQKCETIKESYFGVKKEEVKDELHDVAAGDNASNEDLSKAMAAYTAAISKTKDIKLSNS